MSERYFVVQDNEGIPGRWYLRAPRDPTGQEVDARVFTRGERVKAGDDLVVPLRRAGTPLDFTFADFDMPVVRREVGQIIERLAPADVERIPVSIESFGPGFEILNISRRLRCLDEENSRVMYWNVEDGRPDKVGQYRMVTVLRIDPKRAHGASIFRVDGWPTALIVSDTLRCALLEHEVTGILFDEV